MNIKNTAFLLYSLLLLTSLPENSHATLPYSENSRYPSANSRNTSNRNVTVVSTSKTESLLRKKKGVLKLDYSKSQSNPKLGSQNQKNETSLDTYVDTSFEDKRNAEKTLYARRNTIENISARENRYKSKNDIFVAKNGGSSDSISEEYELMNSSQTSASSFKKKTSTTFSILAEMDQMRSLVNHQDGTEQSSLDYAIYPAFTLYNYWKLKFGLEGTQNQNDSEKSQLNAAFTNLSILPLAMTDYIDWYPSINLSLPVNKDQIDRKSMQASSSLGFTFMLNEEHLPKSLSTGILFLFGKYFHEYTTSTAGEVNTDYSMRQVLFGNLQIAKWLSFYGELHHTWQNDYEGTTSDGFDSKEEVAISPNNNWSFLLGHTNGGSVFKADGMSNNIALVNENSSLMYLGVRAKF